MSLFWKIFLKGLAAMIPLVVTIWAVIWLATTAEDFLSGPIRTWLPEGYYTPGMGVLAGMVVVFMVGLTLNIVIARALFHRFEALLNRLPLVKSLYGSVKDLLGFFMGSQNAGQQVVMVTIPLGTPLSQALPPGMGQPTAGAQATVEQANNDTPASPLAGASMKLLGLVTRTDFADLPPGVGDDQSIAVYLPMSYQLGGFTVIVKRQQVQPIAMSTEDALRFAITAGMNNTRAVPSAAPPDTPPDTGKQPPAVDA